MTRRLAVGLLLLVPVLARAGDEKPRPKPKRAFVGVMIGIDKQKNTIIVLTVLPDSPAQKAGVKASDVLVKINGAKPADLTSTVKVIQSLTPGKKAKLEVLRDGKPKTLEVVPDELSD